MTIRFLKSVAGARASFRVGQVVHVPRLPRGWAEWLRRGIITCEREADDETAVVDAPAEVAVRPRRSRKKVLLDGAASVAG